MHALLALAVFTGALGMAVAALTQTVLPYRARIAQALRREPRQITETAAQQRWRRVHLEGDRPHRSFEERSL